MASHSMLRHYLIQYYQTVSQTIVKKLECSFDTNVKQSLFEKEQLGNDICLNLGSFILLSIT